ncbi:MAG: hypothetical protein OEX00_04715 [Gammaproteobacteria bacterium]|nr:hypothetical protein [Gammaproteobacteria bacterium]
MINKTVLAAAVLSGFTLLIHVFGGGPEVHDPVLASTLSVELKAILSVIWHAITFVLLINSVALVVAAKSPALTKPIVIMVSSQYLAFAALFVFYGITHLGSVAPMPQWIIFSVLAAVGLTGYALQERHKRIIAAA